MITVLMKTVTLLNVRALMALALMLCSLLGDAGVDSVDTCQTMCLNDFIDCLAHCETRSEAGFSMDMSCFATCNGDANDCFLSDCAKWNLKQPADVSVIQ